MNNVNLTVRQGQVKSEMPSQMARGPVPIPIPGGRGMANPASGIEEMALVNPHLIRQRVDMIASRFKLKKVDEKLYEYVTLALQERLRSVTEELVIISRKRTDDPGPSHFTYAETSDTKNVLREIERREREDSARKEAEEKQKILEAARNSKKERKENKALQDKFNRVVQEEEAKRTNNTALMALGDIGLKKRPPANQRPGGPTGAVGQQMPQMSTSASPGALPAQGHQVSKISYRDALLFAERDVDMRLNESLLALKCTLGKSVLKYSNKQN